MEPLKKTQILSLLKDEINDETFLCIKDIKKFVFQMKNVIRIFEYFVVAYYEDWKEKQSIPTFILHIFKIFEQKYGNYYKELIFKFSLIGEKLFHYIITGNPVKKDKEIDDLIRKGIITLNKSNQIKY